jgi:hypothetical protein
MPVCFLFLPMQSLSKRLSSTRSRLAVLIAVILVVSLVATGLYFVFLGQPSVQPAPNFSDPFNDVLDSVGTSYPGMVDVVEASLDKVGNTISVNINVKDQVSSLGQGETASWAVLLVFENETNALKTYQFQVIANFSGMFGSLVNVETDNTSSILLNVAGNSLDMSATLDGLQGATKVEWNINSSYQMLSSDIVTTSASDSAPDNGLQTTLIEAS